MSTTPTPYETAIAKTMYFIGVTTGKSSIMRVFPEWMKALGVDCQIKGMDFKWHDDPEAYREAVAFIKADPLSLGALVTTHKIDLLTACRNLFDELDPHAQLMGEISSISKRDGKLVGHAKDPITSGLSLEAFLPKDHWKRTGAEAFVIGAGGSSIAMTWHLMHGAPAAHRPSRIHVSNRSLPRLEEMQKVHAEMGTTVPVEYHFCPQPEDNDKITGGLKPHSVVINATGLGKDAPGSPLSDSVVFPENGIAWDFNYRGDLVFLDQARKQQAARNLQVEDGWLYFIYGWTRVIAEVLHIDIPIAGPQFNELCRIAAEVR